MVWSSLRFGDFSGQSLFSCFFVLSIAVLVLLLVLLLVLDGLNRLASNTISKVLETIRSRDICRIGFVGGFQVRVPFR